MILSLDYRSSHAHSRSTGASSSGGVSGGGGGSGSSRRGEERDGLSREPSQKVSGSASHPAPSQHLGLCHIHLREQQQLRELQQQAEEQLDINENLVSQGRCRTKSDPTFKSAESIARPDSPTKREEEEEGGVGSGFRSREKTLEPPHHTGHSFCDSCKAKLKAEGLIVEDVRGSGGGGGGKQQCSNACGSREGGAVDLMALPLPGSEYDEIYENVAGKLQPPAPAIAAPPPGFRDNSSDEDDPNKKRKAAAEAVGAAKATAATVTATTATSTVVAEASAAATVAAATAGETQEDVPVTLIDNVATRTVRDHAQELDDALVSTLQALEALAASEDYPHHHQQTPQTAGGLSASQKHSLLPPTCLFLSLLDCLFI